jgi:hypothetical protein
MLNWAVAREYLERTPCRRGNATLIRQEPEDNRRHRRITPADEQRLLAAASPHLKLLIIAAIDTGMRRSVGRLTAAAYDALRQIDLHFGTTCATNTRPAWLSETFHFHRAVICSATTQSSPRNATTRRRPKP